MNSFFNNLWPQILARLQAHATHTPYLLVSVSTGNLHMEQQPWLTEVFPAGQPQSTLALRYFKTN